MPDHAGGTPDGFPQTPSPRAGGTPTRGSPRPPPQAFAFDLDETLADCGWHHVYATKRMMQHARVEEESVREVFEGITGLRTRDIVDAFRVASGIPHELDDLLEVRTRAFREATLERAVVFLPGARDLLDQARAIGPVALVTSGHVGDALATLESLGVHAWFSAIVTGEDVEQPKPHPEPYLRAADLLRVDPRDMLVFEDSAKGIQAALGAGCRAVAVPKETTPVDTVQDADVVLRSMEEALPLVEFLKRL